MMDRVQLSGREDEAAPAGFMEGRFLWGAIFHLNKKSEL